MVLRDQLPEYAEEFVSFAEKGYRVLVFGVYDGILEEPVLTEAVTPLGYILIANPIRKKQEPHLITSKTASSHQSDFWR